MEIFEILYRGKKVNSIKTDEGDIYVKLPIRRGERGNEFQERISRDSNGWKFSSSATDNPEYGFNLWIRDDGKLAYRTLNSKKIFVTKDVFNPDLQNGGKLNIVATELYNIVEQLKAYEKRNIPASSTCKLRTKKLELTLKLLGFSSIDEINSELNDSKGYLALTRIRKQLENYINLGVYIHLEGREDLIRVKVPEEMTREDFIKLAIPVTDEYSSDLDFAKEQDEKREQKRSILPDYCEEMSKKMPYGDWLMYSRVIRETAKLLLELNADLINPNSELQIPDLSELTGTELEDKISKLINSKEFANACDIENRFFIREGKRLIKELDSMLQGADEPIRSSSIIKSLETMKEEEATIIAQRNNTDDRTEDDISIGD